MEGWERGHPRRMAPGRGRGLQLLAGTVAGAVVGGIDQDKPLARLVRRREGLTLDRGDFLAGVAALRADNDILAGGPEWIGLASR